MVITAVPDGHAPVFERQENSIPVSGGPNG